MKTLTDEDLTAAKLKGYNCIVKFHDGEEMLIKSEKMNDEDPSDWFCEVEDYINGKDDSYFPDPGIAIDRKAIKYVKQL
jgi:hypothetical protein